MLYHEVVNDWHASYEWPDGLTPFDASLHDEWPSLVVITWPKDDPVYKVRVWYETTGDGITIRGIEGDLTASLLQGLRLRSVKKAIGERLAVTTEDRDQFLARMLDKGIIDWNSLIDAAAFAVEHETFIKSAQQFLPRGPRPEPPRRGKRTDENFYLTIALQYREAVRTGKHPKPAIAESWDTNPSTVEGWINATRTAGWLARDLDKKGNAIPAGKPNARMGPKLKEWLGMSEEALESLQLEIDAINRKIEQEEL